MDWLMLHDITNFIIALICLFFLFIGIAIPILIIILLVKAIKNIGKCESCQHKNKNTYH